MRTLANAPNQMSTFQLADSVKLQATLQI